MRRTLFSKYVLFHLAFHRSLLSDYMYLNGDQKLKYMCNVEIRLLMSL